LRSAKSRLAQTGRVFIGDTGLLRKLGINSPLQFRVSPTILLKQD
jgi:hypothetical protein